MLHSSTSLYLNDECITSYDRDSTVDIDTSAHTIFTVYDSGFDGNII